MLMYLQRSSYTPSRKTNNSPTRTSFPESSQDLAVSWGSPGLHIVPVKREGIETGQPALFESPMASLRKLRRLEQPDTVPAGHEGLGYGFQPGLQGSFLRLPESVQQLPCLPGRAQRGWGGHEQAETQPRGPVYMQR